MKVIAGALVLWAAGVGLGALGMLAGAAVRERWRRRGRLVAWGTRQRDMQIGSWDDRMRVADQLIIAASRRLEGLAALLLLQEESNRRRQESAIVRMNLMQEEGWPAGLIGVIGPGLDVSDPETWGVLGAIINIKDDSRRDA